MKNFRITTKMEYYTLIGTSYNYVQQHRWTSQCLVKMKSIERIVNTDYVWEHAGPFYGSRY